MKNGYGKMGGQKALTGYPGNLNIPEASDRLQHYKRQ